MANARVLIEIPEQRTAAFEMHAAASLSDSEAESQANGLLSNLASHFGRPLLIQS